MAKKKSEEEKVVSDQEPVAGEEVYDINALWSMRFRDPETGTITMIRKTFRPRGKLEFYAPKE